MNYHGMDNLESEQLKHLPNVNSLLKISLGLILFTLLSSALVYAETVSVNVEGNSFDVEYTAEQVVVNSIIAEYEPNSDYAGLIINVEVTGNSGTLDFIFDRSFFDSTFDGVDDPFFVIADGLEVPFTETTTTQSRTLSIEVPAGTEDLEIIGTVFGDSAPIVETPEEEPPVVETPEEEPPVVETPPVEETQKTQCGPGTILEDGACVLDERCGPGTVLEDGTCVLVTTPQSSSVTIPKGMGSELVIGTIAAFGVAAAIAIILALISRADTRKN